MSHKVHPQSYRLGINETWNARWFENKEYAQKLREDILIREYLRNKTKTHAIESVDIERTMDNISVVIYTSRPGIIIGRSGTGVEVIKADLSKALRKANPGKQSRLPELRLEVKEIRDSETFASLVALNVVEQLERRVPFRQAMKRSLDRVRANKAVGGVKISIAGRLGGADMARREWIKEGNLPRNTLRSSIDFAVLEANTTYGVIGVKVWIYKGQKLN